MDSPLGSSPGGIQGGPSLDFFDGCTPYKKKEIEELEEAFSKMSPVERANLGDVDELIAAADADGDGRIDFDEFMAMMN